MDRILVFRSAVLGDFILSSPAIQLIRDENPEATICLLTIQSAHQKDRNAVKVYENKKVLPWLDLLDSRIVDKVIPMQSVDFSYLLHTLRPAVKEFAPTKCYVLTDPLVGFKGNIAKVALLRFLGARCKIYGWRDYVKSKGEKLRADPQLRCVNHTLSCLESVFEDPSLHDDEIVVRFPITANDTGRAEASDLWDNLHLNKRRVVVISPGGIKPHKIWPADNYVTVIRHLLKDENTTVLLTGTQKDIDTGLSIVENVQSERVINLINQTGLPFLAGILEKADLLLGTDGGTMHLGDAVGCTVVTIMPKLELPGAVTPWHNVNNAVYSDFQCGPCYCFDDCPQKTYKCINTISVERILEQIDAANNYQLPFNRVVVQVKRVGRRPLLVIKR